MKKQNFIDDAAPAPVRPSSVSKQDYTGTPRGIEYWASLELALETLKNVQKEEASFKLALLALDYVEALKKKHGGAK